jgi:hypothetical protein
MKFSTVIVIALLCFVIIGSGEAHATFDGKVKVSYGKSYNTSSVVMAYNDLSKIDLKLIDVQVLPMDDTPGYSLDDADLLKVRISVTNNGPQRFTVLDKMFEIWVAEPSKTDPNDLTVIDNYDTSYDDQLEVTYEEMNSRELFIECDQTIEHIDTGKSFNFTLCYDILRARNNYAVDLDGPRKYFLVMMDNKQASSCPNCKKVLLTNNLEPQIQQLPKWVQNLYVWKENNLISETDLQNALEYLASKGIVSAVDPKLTHSLFLKNQELAKYQKILSEAYNKNLFVSAIEFFEPKHSDSFSGVVCKKQNNVITLDGYYTNDDAQYDTVFFRLLVYDDSGNMTAQGLSKIVYVAPKQYRHFFVSTPLVESPNYCVVNVDSKFP